LPYGKPIPASFDKSDTPKKIIAYLYWQPVYTRLYFSYWGKPPNER